MVRYTENSPLSALISLTEFHTIVLSTADTGNQLCNYILLTYSIQFLLLATHTGSSGSFPLLAFAEPTEDTPTEPAGGARGAC